VSWVLVLRKSPVSSDAVGFPIYAFLPGSRAAQPPSTRVCSDGSWTADRDDPSFEDGSGHVIGHFMADLPVAGEAGVLPYVFVERVDETLEKVVAHGGEVVTPPYPEATCG
jgi:hypothetical protein